MPRHSRRCLQSSGCEIRSQRTTQRGSGPFIEEEVATFIKYVCQGTFSHNSFHPFSVFEGRRRGCFRDLHWGRYGARQFTVAPALLRNISDLNSCMGYTHCRPVQSGPDMLSLVINFSSETKVAGPNSTFALASFLVCMFSNQPQRLSGSRSVCVFAFQTVTTRESLDTVVWW